MSLAAPQSVREVSFPFLMDFPDGSMRTGFCELQELPWEKQGRKRIRTLDGGVRVWFKTKKLNCLVQGEMLWKRQLLESFL